MRMIGGPFSPGRDGNLLFNFGGNSQSSTNNTENVTQPTTTVTGGTGANAVSTTGAVTFNQESPQAISALSGAVNALQSTAQTALSSGLEAVHASESVIGKSTESTTQQLAPVFIAIAVMVTIVGGIYAHSRGKS